MLNDTIILLAAGPSVRQYNIRGLEERGHLIAINGAALYSKPHTAFSMDRKASEFCYSTWCVQGVPRIYLRACTIKSIEPGPNVTLFQHDGPDTKMTLGENALNGSNSGTCALNLAYQLACRKGYKRAFLLGFDMQRDEEARPYWFPPYEWNPSGSVKKGTYAAWAKEFDEIAVQFKEINVEVFNVNHRSLIQAFTTITFDRFREMTK